MAISTVRVDGRSIEKSSIRSNERSDRRVTEVADCRYLEGSKAVTDGALIGARDLFSKACADVYAMLRSCAVERAHCNLTIASVSIEELFAGNTAHGSLQSPGRLLRKARNGDSEHCSESGNLLDHDFEVLVHAQQLLCVLRGGVDNDVANNSTFGSRG